MVIAHARPSPARCSRRSRATEHREADHRPALRPPRRDRRRPEHRRRQGLQAAARRAVGMGARLALDRVPSRSARALARRRSGARERRALQLRAHEGSGARLARRCPSSPTSTRSRCATRSPPWRTSSAARPSSSTISSTRSSILPEHILEQHAAGAAEDGRGRRAAASAPGASASRSGSPGSALELVADTANYRGRAEARPHRVSRRRPTSTRRSRASSPATRTSSSSSAPSTSRRSPRTRRGAPSRIPSLGYAYLAFNNRRSRSSRVSRTRSSATAPCVARSRWRSIAARCCSNVFGTLRRRRRTGPSRARCRSPTRRCRSSPTTPRAARALLDSAGWLLGPDGVRAKNGRRLEFGDHHAGVERRAQAVRRAAAGGVQARRRGGAHRRGRHRGLHGAGTATAASTRASSSYNTDPSPSGFKQSWSTSGLGKDGSNYASYSNPAVDALLDSATLTFDPARTRAYARRAFETIIEDAPGIWLYEPPTVAGVHKRIHTNDDARRRLLVGDGRLVDPGRRAHRAGSHRAPARRRRPCDATSPAGCCRRRSSCSSSRRSPSCSSTSRPATRSRCCYDGRGLTEEVRQQWRASLGLDRPLGEQYLRWVGEHAARRPRLLDLTSAVRSPT